MTGRDFEMLIYDYPAKDEYDYGEKYDLEYCRDIMKILEILTPRERKVLIMRFGLDGEPPMEKRKVGDFFNVTRHRIDQIQQKAFRKLRTSSRLKLFQKYYKGKPIPNWVWSDTMHEYASIEETENPSCDIITDLPLPWKNGVENLKEFEEQLKKERFHSILRTIGYDSRLPEEERHDVIRYAVYACGFEKIRNNLKMIISVSKEELKQIYISDFNFLEEDEACRFYEQREERICPSYNPKKEEEKICALKQDERYKVTYITNDGTVEIKSKKRDKLNTLSIIKMKGIQPIILLSITWEESYLVKADQLTLETEDVSFKFYNVDYDIGRIDVYIYDEAVELLKDMIKQRKFYLFVHVDGKDSEKDGTFYFDKEEVCNIYKGYMKIRMKGEDNSLLKAYHPYDKIVEEDY